MPRQAWPDQRQGELDRGVRQRLLIGLGKSDVSRGSVSFRLSDSGRAGDDNDGVVADCPGQCDSGRGDAVASPDRAQLFQQRSQAAEVSRGRRKGLYDTAKLEDEIKALMVDDDVTRKKGIYSYVLTRDEKYLSIRAFTEAQRRAADDRQGVAGPRLEIAPGAPSVNQPVCHWGTWAMGSRPPPIQLRRRPASRSCTGLRI
jgi:hypothetical protein